MNWREAGSPHPIGRFRRWVAAMASRLARFVLRDYPAGS
jgi:hypothetical protein